MLSVEDWAEIRRLRRAEGLPIKVIARTLGVARNTVRSALAADGPPKYERQAKASLADAFESRIRELLQAFPSMPATVIAERIGWPYSVRTLSGKVAQWRPAYLPPDPASRTSYDAGELAQCDFWFPDIELPVGFGQSRTAKRLPVLTMASGYSRWLSAVLVPSRQAEDLFAGSWQVIGKLGAVPRCLVWDGEGAVGRWRGAEGHGEPSGGLVAPDTAARPRAARRRESPPRRSPDSCWLACHRALPGRGLSAPSQAPPPVAGGDNYHPAQEMAPGHCPDLGLRDGAGDENRTRTISLGS